MLKQKKLEKKYYLFKEVIQTYICRNTTATKIEKHIYVEILKKSDTKSNIFK